MASTDPKTALLQVPMLMAEHPKVSTSHKAVKMLTDPVGWDSGWEGLEGW